MVPLSLGDEEDVVLSLADGEDAAKVLLGVGLMVFEKRTEGFQKTQGGQRRNEDNTR